MWLISDIVIQFGSNSSIFVTSYSLYPSVTFYI